MNKQEKQQIRLKVWQKLKNVALPDSRFHLNFEEYIPDFKDSINAHDQIIKSEEYKKSKLLFITPDNCLTTIREQAIKDEKDIIVSTYGIYRGLILITKNMVNKGNEVFASTLDGLEHFGKNISLKEIKNLTIEVEKLSNKRLYKRLKNINKNDPKSDKYELQIKLIIDEYGRFLDVDIKNLENNYNNYINRFVKKLLKKSKWSPSMTIFKDKNNNYRMERNSIFFSIHFIII